MGFLPTLLISLVITLCFETTTILIVCVAVLTLLFVIFKKQIFISAVLGITIGLCIITFECNPKYGSLAHLLNKPFDAQLLIVETDYQPDKNNRAVCKIVNKDNHKVVVYFYGETLPEINDLVKVKNFKLKSPADSPPKYSYYDLNLKSRGIRYTAFASEKYYKVIAKNQGRFPAKEARTFNCFLEKKIQSTFQNERTSAFLSGLLLGNKDKFSEEDYNALKISGSVHIVSVSGFHVMLFLSLLGSLLSKLPKVSSDIITSLFLLFLILVTGCTPSVIRASVMVIIAILISYISRDRNAESALCIVALFLIISNRYIIHNASFVLSFAATYGIIKSCEALNHFAEFVPSIIRTSACTCICAQIGVFPAMMYYFGSISMYSLVPNIIISFMAPVLFILTPVTLLTELKPLILICDLLCNILFDVVHFFAKMPFSTFSYEFGTVSLLIITVICYLILNLIFELYIKHKRKIMKGALLWKQ